MSILRDRVDALGVAEPEIRKESGNRISVAVAGENDPQRVFDLVGSTGKLYFIDLEEGLTPVVSPLRRRGRRHHARRTRCTSC